MSKNVELEPGARYEYLGCYVTILNLSKHLLKNVQFHASWGKYTRNPSTQIEGGKKASTTLIIVGRDSWPSGSEGVCTYEVSAMGGGSVSFSYCCPYSGDNYGRTRNDSADLVLLSLYGQIGNKIGIDGGWGLDPSKWGTEGHVPISNHPLALLFVISDK